MRYSVLKNKDGFVRLILPLHRNILELYTIKTLFSKMRKLLVYNMHAMALIRWKQFYRTLWQIGVFRVAILLVFFLFLFAAVYVVSEERQKAAIICGIWICLIVYIHASRLDKIFLCINVGFDKWIYGFEYFILSIPLMICLLLRRQWLPVLCLIFFSLGIGLLKINRKKQRRTFNTFLQQYIPSDMYEWKAGVRQNLIVLMIVWLLGLCTAFFVASVPIAMFLIGLLMTGFYQSIESWQILLSYQKNANQLLFYKIRQHSLFYTILNLPLIMLFMIFHLELWYIPVVEFIILFSIHIYSIVLKYAFYSQDRRSVRSVLMLLGMLIGLNPLLTPALWLFTIYLFLKARINLYPYLNDYN